MEIEVMKKMGYTETEAPTCSNCSHSKIVPTPKWEELHCALNPIVEFKVKESGRCNYFKADTKSSK